MILDPDDPNVRAATFGKIVEDFFAGPIGEYLIEQAERDLEEATQALKIVDAEDPKLIRKFQNDAHVASKILQWIADAVLKGHMAITNLQEDIDGD